MKFNNNATFKFSKGSGQTGHFGLYYGSTVEKNVAKNHLNKNKFFKGVVRTAPTWQKGLTIKLLLYCGLNAGYLFFGVLVDFVALPKFGGFRWLPTSTIFLVTLRYL